jgi:hypothetical protein
MKKNEKKFEVIRVQDIVKLLNHENTRRMTKFI